MQIQILSLVVFNIQSIYFGLRRIAIGQNSSGDIWHFPMKVYFKLTITGGNKEFSIKNIYNADCVNSKVKHPLSVQVWGAIYYYGKSQLKMVNGNLDSVKYQNEILQDITLKCDCLAYPMRNYIIMHYKTPCHFSDLTQRYLADGGVVVLAWPGNSPDVNPMEKVCDIMQKSMKKCQITAQNYGRTYLLFGIHLVGRH